jgi:predicted DCC family thiol-disulfide oxidoreductase YuxK
MNELTTMETAVQQLRAAVGDDPELLPMRLSADVLANAISAAKDNGINAARVNDLEFALSDLMSAVDDAGAPDVVLAAVAQLQNDTAALRRANALPRETVSAIRDLVARLRTRAKALERNQYRVEGAEPAAAPHPPAELRELAIPIARELAAGGFATHELDQLIANPDSLRYHSVNEIADELEVIAGS